ncbi:MAG: DNA polymerase III subunit beta, partial [Longimicrobiales bacterium]
MNFTITRQNLHSGLAAVSASIPSKTTLPVLSNILFEASDDGVWMSGTDLDVAVRVKVLADVKESGSLTAPGKKLQEITRELPDQPVDITTRGDQIELSCGASRFKLNGLPADEFPTLAEVDFSDGITVTGKDLNGLIHHTSFAVSTEESRPILNGVLWELRDGEMKMVATNGHRLARMGVTVDPTGTPSADFIVPPAALAQVQRLFKDDDSLQVARSGNHLGFRADTTEIYTRLIAVVASDQTHRIRLRFESGRAHLNVLTPDLGEGHDEMEVGYDGEELEIGFNANYLLEVLRHIPSDEVKFAFKAPERAATIEPA